MEDRFSRTEMLFGKDDMKKIYDSHIAVFGIGGVGGYAVEALARCGVGEFDLFDKDVVSISNINRQIIATTKTIGKPKVDVMKERILDINPNAKVNVYHVYYTCENSKDYDLSKYSYIVDAIDTITSKIHLIVEAKKAQIPIISCMGAGNKLDPTTFRIADIYETSVCPLARVMRHELKKRSVKNLKVVYSTEKPQKPINENKAANELTHTKQTPASNAFVPSVAGLIMASEIIKELRQ